MTAPRPSGSRAVLFGAHAFDGFPALGGVERNVPALLALLTAPDVGGLAEDDCRVLPADSRADDVLDAVADAAGEADDLLLVYYAGHGHHTDEGLLLATRKADLDRPHHFVEYARVRDFVAGSRARHKVVIVDCCYAGGALHMGRRRRRSRSGRSPSTAAACWPRRRSPNAPCAARTAACSPWSWSACCATASPGRCAAAGAARSSATSSRPTCSTRSGRG
ncbi:caspase family protein [Streptomyces sp. DHE7-1]|nr:caspase family protein [Streptomyces sp. DHE7-1]